MNPGLEPRGDSALAVTQRPTGSWLNRVVSRASLGLVRSMPAGVQRWLAGAVAGVAWTLGIRRAVALDNLEQAYPEAEVEWREATARGAYRTMALAALDAVTSDLVEGDELEARVRCDDWRGLDVLAREGRPALVATAHLGSWELLGEVLARRGMKLTAVVRPLSGAFNAHIIEARRRAGMEVVLQRGAVMGMLDAVARGRVVVQLIDQAVGAESAVWAPFFGRLASTSPALSVVAERTGLPVLVGVAAREGRHLRLVFDGPVPVPGEGTRRERIAAHTVELTRRLEALVRRWPDQWLWLHRRWKGSPPGPAARELQAQGVGRVSGSASPPG